ncbi:MAG TPA: ABC-F family ATP-binding cassette domain-containing protein [Candidatus Polarisedimenticolaceae bacterium]|nr:ABC-F family ATP-binding cassette domain-containing protein [Candidatus Polarisedimenticolaceae bacterium]
MIQLDNVTRRFGARVLFEGLSWTVKPRARIGLVGPNGAGKTTLLRLLAGDDEPDLGAVHRAGSLEVGFLPQEVETVVGDSVLAVALAGFAEVSRLDARLAELARRLARARDDDEESRRLAAEYGTLRGRLEALDGDRVEARATAILSGLGFAAGSLSQPPAVMSGGWRMRAVLARLLVGTPDLLLLDEPTNHLDLEQIDWLERYLAEYEGAFVAVSHDRYFLNRIVDTIVELDRGELTPFRGDYDAYVETKQRREAALDQATRHQAREIAKVERFIERFRYKNTKARQVQSRVRTLSKLERVRVEPKTSSIRFRFPPAPRSGDVVARVEAVDKRFGELEVYRRASLLLRRGDRVALVGDNGAGKSTLLKLLAGRLAPDAGRVELGHQVELHYYAQHQLDALDPARSVLEELEAVASPEDRPRLRGLAGRFLFHGDDVAKRVAVLSGGEKARLALGKMLLRPANLLLLDEPTNHLDLVSREVLEDALDEFGGTVVLISHDRYFINRVVTRIVHVVVGSLQPYDGDYDEFVRQRDRCALVAPEPDAAGPEADGPRRERRAERRREAEERNRRYRDRKRIEEALRPIEREVAGLERLQRELEAEQARPEVYADPAEARRVAREKERVVARLEQLYQRWEEVARGLV